MPAATLSVLVGPNFACLKVAGRASFACSPDFKTVLEELMRKKYTHFIIDLTDCVLMDSTFLGILAGFGIRLNPAGAPPLGVIELHNATGRIKELLENLGADHLFRHASGPLQLPAEVVGTCTPEAGKPTHEELTRTSLEAHQTLMAMNPENIARFKDVAQFLAEDLNSLRQRPG